MTTKRLVYQFPDGSIRVAMPMRKSRCHDLDESLWLDNVHRRNMESGMIPEGTIRLRNHDVTEFPDVAKRYAWRAGLDGEIEIDKTASEPVREKTDIEKRVEALEAAIKATFTGLCVVHQ